MKKAIKKLMAALLAAVMLCAMAVPALADGSSSVTGDGSITITNAAVDETYTIYRIFDLESYSGTNYSYKLSTKWANFANDSTFTAYFTTTNGYVTVKDESNYKAHIDEFAKAALKYADDNSIENDGSKTATSSTVNFNSLPLGYYLVDTTQGTLCSLNTAAEHVNITDKTDKPTVDKKILDNNKKVTDNTASIGDKIQYQVTIHAKNGGSGYVLNDTMTEGLTFNNDVEVSVNSTNLVKNTDYEVKIPGNNGATFSVEFKQSYLDNLTADTDIIVSYSATLNEKAKISTDTNSNTAQLKFGNASTVEERTTTTSFKFDLVKTDSSNTLLAGAKFKLYDAENGGHEIYLVKEDDHTYRISKSANSGDEIVTMNDKPITIKGLGNGTYWLEEIEQPTGYNKLDRRASFTIEDANLTTTMTGTTWVEGNGGVHITNNAGAVLPSTGGIGTTIFYIIGGGLMVAAIVLLVTKKRMENK